MSWFGRTATVIPALLSVYFLLQTLLVFSQRAILAPDGFGVVGWALRNGIEWRHVERAVLRERVNVVSRTDHLLILEGSGSKVLFNTSTLDPQVEEQLLNGIRRHVTVIVQRDKPTL